MNGSIDLTLNRLTHVNFGTLSFIGGDLDVRNINAFLIQLLLGNLAHVGKKVYLLNTACTIRNGTLASDVDLSWTGLQLVDLGTGGVTTIDAPTMILGADTVDMGGVRMVKGALIIVNATTLDFGDLLTVTGTFNVLGAQVRLTEGFISPGLNWTSRVPPISSVNFGSISRIGGFLNLYKNQLTSITISSLVNIDSLSLEKNQLTSINFATLQNVSGDINLSDNKITSINFGPITSIQGSLQLARNQLDDFSFPVTLSIAGLIYVCSNPGATALLATCMARFNTQCHNATTC